jgi:hypothetical protein
MTDEQKRKLGQMSKEEEGKVLAALVNKYKDTGTYLGSLFTWDLLNWFRGRMSDDWSCDWLSEHTDALRKAQEADSRVAATRLAGEAAVNEVKRELVEAQAEVVKLNAYVAGLTATLARERAIAAELQQDANRTLGKYGETMDKMRCVENSLREQQRVNMALKARIFDAEHPQVDPDAQD